MAGNRRGGSRQWIPVGPGLNISSSWPSRACGPVARQCADSAHLDYGSSVYRDSREL